jgi:hypothetical protein
MPSVLSTRLADKTQLDALVKQGCAAIGWVNGNHYINLTAVDATGEYNEVADVGRLSYVTTAKLNSCNMHNNIPDVAKEKFIILAYARHAEGLEAKDKLSDQIRGSTPEPVFTNADFPTGTTFTGLPTERIAELGLTGQPAPRLSAPAAPEQLTLPPIERIGPIQLELALGLPRLPAQALAQTADTEAKKMGLKKIIDTLRETYSVSGGSLEADKVLPDYLEATGNNALAIKAQALRDADNTLNIRWAGFIETVNRLKQDARLDGRFGVAISAEGKAEEKEVRDKLKEAFGEGFEKTIAVANVEGKTPSEAMEELKKKLAGQLVIDIKDLKGMIFGFDAESAGEFVGEIKQRPAGIKFAAICADVKDTAKVSLVEGSGIVLGMMAVKAGPGTVIQIGGEPDDPRLNILRDAGISILPVITAENISDSITQFRKAAEAFARSM